MVIREGFTNQLRRVATEKDVVTCWHGGKNGKLFYCGMCGHKFRVGDGWRWVYANSEPRSAGNFFVCDDCDTPDVLKRRALAIEEADICQDDVMVLAAKFVRLRMEASYGKG